MDSRLIAETSTASDRGTTTNWNASSLGEGGDHTDAKTVELMGIPVCRMTEADCIQWVVQSLRHGRGGILYTPNLEILRLAQVDRVIRRSLLDADVLVADGAPLLWASRLLGQRLPERVAGSNLIYSLTSAAAREGLSVFFLGGNPGTAEATAEILRERSPDLRVAGCWCPPFGFLDDPGWRGDLQDRMNHTAADIVYIALDFRKTVVVASQCRDLAPRSWWVGVGQSFSFVSGEQPRAPRWMQVSGMEWCHRLWCEPRRLARRYLLHGIPFGARLISHTMIARIQQEMRILSRDGG